MQTCHYCTYLTELAYTLSASKNPIPRENLLFFKKSFITSSSASIKIMRTAQFPHETGCNTLQFSLVGSPLPLRLDTKRQRKQAKCNSITPNELPFWECAILAQKYLLTGEARCMLSHTIIVTTWSPGNQYSSLWPSIQASKNHELAGSALL